MLMTYKRNPYPSSHPPCPIQSPQGTLRHSQRHPLGGIPTHTNQRDRDVRFPIFSTRPAEDGERRTWKSGNLLGGERYRNHAIARVQGSRWATKNRAATKREPTADQRLKRALSALARPSARVAKSSPRAKLLESDASELAIAIRRFERHRVSQQTGRCNQRMGTRAQEDANVRITPTRDTRTRRRRPRGAPSRSTLRRVRRRDRMRRAGGFGFGAAPPRRTPRIRFGR